MSAYLAASLFIAKHLPETGRKAPCDWPVIYGSGFCCNSTPCQMQWRRACDETGGCPDRATCGGCDEPYLPENEKASPK